MHKDLTAGRPARAPTHPGAMLRETMFPALQMPIAEAAGHLGVTRQTLHRLLSERTAVTPAMALRLGKFCGNGLSLWLRMQQAYEIRYAENALRDEVKRIPTFKNAA